MVLQTHHKWICELDDIDIDLLRNFVGVAESGGVSAAELSLRTNKSKISNKLKLLEEQLGYILILRKNGMFALTEEGMEIYRYANDLFAEVKKFQSKIANLSESPQGKITIGILDSLLLNPENLLPKVIALFDELAPNVYVSLMVDSVSRLESGLKLGLYDVGIFPVGMNENLFHTGTFFTEKMYLYCSHEHPLYNVAKPTLDEIKTHKLAGVCKNSPNMSMVNKFGLTRAADVLDQEATALLIESGKYIGFLPEELANSLSKHVPLKPILPEYFTYITEVKYVVEKHLKETRNIKTFVECIEEIRNY